MSINKFNSEGYYDPTAYEATQHRTVPGEHSCGC